MKSKLFLSAFLVLLVLVIPMTAFATNGVAVDTGDTAFMMICVALVFMMTPGLAFFYGGMVRKKNVLGTMMHSFTVIALISIQWILIGYTIAFGSDHWSLIGNFQWLGLKGIGFDPNPVYAATIPHALFVAYQMMFAIITPALISGAFAERMRFSVFIVFILLWSTLVYDPLAHWVWGDGGWLRKLGCLDFAGGTVVHISSGVAGLVAALVIGRRKGYRTIHMVPHNIPFVILGTTFLWVGWFGFNAGSALGISGITMTAFITTNTAAAAAMLSWIVVEWISDGKPTALGAVTGAVVGLVAITPGAGFVSPISAIIIGLSVSPICYFGVSVVKTKLGYDDSLDAFGCHGIGGIWGALATGFFASKAVNPAGADGLFFGNTSLVGIQLIGVVATIVLSSILTFVILKIMSLFTSLRVDEEAEIEGLDISEHGKEAYSQIA